jgi:putative transcriptional regulator
MTAASDMMGGEMSASPSPESGARVKAARNAAGLTQPQLAERVGVGRATVARIEAGEVSPSVAVALAIARELGESVERLFGGDR